MKIGFLLSTHGGSPLQAGLVRGFKDLGHEVVETNKPDGLDLLLVFNQCAHTLDYEYPAFPDNPPLMAFIDTAEYGYFNRTSDRCRRFWNAFAEGSMSHDTKNPVQQERLRQWLQGRSFPYFLREHIKELDYPDVYHPIDYPLYLHSECHLAPDRDEFMARQKDLFVCWGASHPWRMNISDALRKCSVRSEIMITGNGAQLRLDQLDYFNRTRAAKCSASYDGYGSSSFRLHEVLVRCLLLCGPLSIRRFAPLVDGVHCLNYDVDYDGEQFVGTNVGAKLLEALADQDRAFAIHRAGYYHCMENYTETATAKYVLKTVESHDWSKPTVI